jgi:hypothetical protein
LQKQFSCITQLQSKYMFLFFQTFIDYFLKKSMLGWHPATRADLRYAFSASEAILGLQRQRGTPGQAGAVSQARDAKG